MFNLFKRKKRTLYDRLRDLGLEYDAAIILDLQSHAMIAGERRQFFNLTNHDEPIIMYKKDEKEVFVSFDEKIHLLRMEG